CAGDGVALAGWKGVGVGDCGRRIGPAGMAAVAAGAPAGGGARPGLGPRAGPGPPRPGPGPARGGGGRARACARRDPAFLFADATTPFSFTEIEPFFASARATVEAVALRFHPETATAWAQFSLPEVLLLTERLSRDVRREALHHIPGVRAIRLSHLLWVHTQH